MYKLKKIVGSNNFSAQSIKIISHFKMIGCNNNVLQQTACLVVNPILVGNFAFLFNCTPVGVTSYGLTTCDFSTLYTTLPHNLIKENLTELIEQTFNREGSLYLACNDKNAFFTSEQPKRYKLWSCQKLCDALHYLLDNIFIKFGSKLYRQIVGIPVGTNCAPLVADLFLFCYVRDFMLSLSDNDQTDIIEAFN